MAPPAVGGRREMGDGRREGEGKGGQRGEGEGERGEERKEMEKGGMENQRLIQKKRHWTQLFFLSIRKT